MADARARIEEIETSDPIGMLDDPNIGPNVVPDLVIVDIPMCVKVSAAVISPAAFMHLVA